ncbi:glutamine-rich protein 2 isoform X2 [Mauremys reevesii]|uniref:glutamine-rich protein 2 isoform X2 n=1 Tax=Mauremys reevesii TaxID=260615 RepID=UPI00193FB1B2|nr:glutamine-rich protein 2 isoform X2 [Mauremys reevesii]
MALISLLELADLSIGTPEIGVVNFNALHTLLHAIIKQLNLQDVKAEMHDEKPKPPEPVPLQEEERKGKRDESEDFPYADLEKKVIGVATQVHGVEAKVVGVAAQVHGVEDQVHGVKSQVHGIGEQVQGLEKQMAALEKLPSGTDLLERTKSGSPNGSAVADMWQMMQMKKKIEANENGISKAMALFQDLLNEVNGVKTANFHMNEGLENIKEKLGLNLQLDTQEIGNQLQTCIADQKNLDNDVRNLERRINLYPSPEEMYNMVRWEVLEDCLVTGKGKSPPTEQINHLEQFKCSRADLDKLRQFLSDAVPKNLSSMPADLMDQLSSLKATAEDMKDVKAKVRKLQNVLEAEVATEADQKEKGSSQINLQLGYLRSTVHDIEKELQELREQQDHGKAKLEQSVTDTALYLQEQLDKLRSIIENMMTSSSTLLSMSMPTSPAPGEAAPHGTCPACSLDVSEQVSQLFKRYEQLQDLISSFMTRHAESKPAKRPPLRSQDEELLSRIQNTILQVQGDCENLNATTGNLIEDHQQKQKDIALLFQSLEKLEKEKADKEHLETEIDVKADKIALAGKVSRTQFDATTEQLNKMMQDLVNKMSGQEQDWHKVLDKILVEMDSKLDRLELDPFRQQLEERWKAIRKQLKERAPQYAADDAAGIRKRLMAHFHCISCDRPLEMVVPGPTIMTIPSVPGLPSHRSLRPYTVYELEQVRQHTRSDKMAEMAEYGYLSMPRRCGGSHTLTYPYRRYTRLQQIAQCMPVHPEETAMLTVMKHEEVDILGLDGHIYKGRMDTRLPSISAKDGPLKSKPKMSRSSSQRQPTLMDAAGIPARPHSAKLSSPSNSGTARSLKDRPVSSEGRLSRVDLTHLSASTPPPEEGREDSPTQEKETLELQLDLPMRRRSAEQPAPLQ